MFIEASYSRGSEVETVGHLMTVAPQWLFRER